MKAEEYDKMLREDPILEAILSGKNKVVVRHHKYKVDGIVRTSLYEVRITSVNGDMVTFVGGLLGDNRKSVNSD